MEAPLRSQVNKRLGSSWNQRFPSRRGAPTSPSGLRGRTAPNHRRVRCMVTARARKKPRLGGAFSRHLLAEAGAGASRRQCRPARRGAGTHGVARRIHRVVGGVGRGRGSGRTSGSSIDRRACRAAGRRGAARGGTCTGRASAALCECKRAGQYERTSQCDGRELHDRFLSG